MSISFRILGQAGRDNALLVQVDSGQGVERLLFDCGEGCVAELAFAEVLAVDHLFFSHLHMDHVAGFDSFFRATFDRDRASRPNHIWGPPGTGRILQHRFQGFLWNLLEDMAAARWQVSDIHLGEVRTARFELREAFGVAHEEGARPHAGIVWEGTGCTVEAVTMDHKTPTLGYIVREKARRNIDTSRLPSLGLRPGPWLKQVKEESPGGSAAAEVVVIDGVTHPMEELRQKLIVETPGDAIAYLTDFILDEAALERLTEALRGCRVMVCEGQYRHADLELARKHHHMTSVLSATLAQQAQVGELVLFHLSERYQRGEWLEMLREARQIFPKTSFAPHWGLEES